MYIKISSDTMTLLSHLHKIYKPDVRIRPKPLPSPKYFIKRPNIQKPYHIPKIPFPT